MEAVYVVLVGSFFFAAAAALVRIFAFLTRRRRVSERPFVRPDVTDCAIRSVFVFPARVQPGSIGHDFIFLIVVVQDKTHNWTISGAGVVLAHFWQCRSLPWPVGSS